MKFEFEVYAEFCKTVEIEADSVDEAWSKMRKRMNEVDMSDATELKDSMHERYCSRIIR